MKFRRATAGTIRTLVLLAVLAWPACARDRPEDRKLVPLGRARISAIYDLDARPPYAYALERENLRVLDIRDPTRVQEVANLEFEGPRLRSVLHGSHLYLAGFREPLAVVDIADPKVPRWIGEHPEVDGTVSIFLHDERLYVVRKKPGALLLDVLDPRHGSELPVRLATLDLHVDAGPGFEYGGLAHDAGHLYILVRPHEAPQNEILVVDIGDPSSPTLAGRMLLPEGLAYNDLEVRGHLAYLLTRGSWGLAVFRISSTGALEQLGVVTDPRLWFGVDMMLNGDAIYATFKGEALLATFDVGDPRHPRLAHVFAPKDWHAAALGFSMAEDRLYVSGDAGPSSIFDVRDSLSPRYVGRWDYRGGWAADVEFHNQIAVILSRWFGIFLYDFSDPTTPRRLGSYSPGVSFRQVQFAAHRNRALLTFDSHPAELLDLAVPAAPVVLQRFPISEPVTASALTSTHAILGSAAGNVTVIDLQTSRTSTLSLAAPVTDVALHGLRATVAHADGTISVLSLEDPGKPGLIGRTMAVGSVEEGLFTSLALSADGTMAFTIQGAREREDGRVLFAVTDIASSNGPRALGRLEVEIRDYAPQFPILVWNGDVLVGLGTELVRINVADPAAPASTGRFRLKMSMAAEGLARLDDMLVVGAGEDGALVFELPD